VLQSVAVCFSVWQCVAACCSHSSRMLVIDEQMYASNCIFRPFDGVLQCVAVCCSVLQYIVVCCSMLQSPPAHDRYR